MLIGRQPYKEPTTTHHPNFAHGNDLTHPSVANNGTTLHLLPLCPQSRHLTTNACKLHLLGYIDTLANLARVEKINQMNETMKAASQEN